MFTVEYWDDYTWVRPKFAQPMMYDVAERFSNETPNTRVVPW